MAMTVGNGRIVGKASLFPVIGLFLSLSLSGCSAGGVFQKAIEEVRSLVATAEEAAQKITGKNLDPSIMKGIRNGLDQAEKAVPKVQEIQNFIKDPGVTASPFQD